MICQFKRLIYPKAVTAGDASYMIALYRPCEKVMDAAGNVALLLGSGQLHQAVLLDKSLNVQFSGTVSSANSIVRAGSLFYLLSDSGVECYNTSGEQQWSQTLAAKPQALLADTKELLLFSGNTAQVLEVPQK